MKIKVIKASLAEESWYSECIGRIFEVLDIPAPVLYFSNHLFFLPQDVVRVETKEEALLPVIGVIGIA